MTKATGQLPFLDVQDDPLEWLEEFLCVVRANKWTDNQAIAVAFLQMHKDARIMFYLQNNGKVAESAAYSLQEFEAVFRTHFQTTGYKYKAYNQALHYLQGEEESIDSVVANMLSLFRSANIEDEETKCRLFSMALNDRLFEAIQRDPKDTFVGMVAVARQEYYLEKALAERRRHRKIIREGENACSAPLESSIKPIDGEIDVGHLISQMSKLTSSQISKVSNAISSLLPGNPSPQPASENPHPQPPPENQPSEPPPENQSSAPPSESQPSEPPPENPSS
ncbi:hypothetical protein BX616_009028 [Lobosporangium transversale]|uniref:Uncharacterized protein n=1 Tax=Lobosporangium transversale TaxID=64571 RepID=A0A1Y2GWI0_9FUNG|nr:hypothetical protein BCR41DRAFT_347730 [Lobosporangium transversale]KAF9914077.1 hypothetical protein BX616_009028 [Lobosporangium transversale]ORZ26656.1 hypothetical protein BCR41DRAFT_347730 [Lobosporangium transversale]|eukprot:XP_021884419.1 hypothetical protein BCR41DRAFT_347730 [Lobosporangium transversale]